MEGAQDPARGYEAARKVVKQGVLDERYKRGAKAYTRIIVAMPLVIYLSYELYRRRFLGVEQKKLPAVGEKKGGGVEGMEEVG